MAHVTGCYPQLVTLFQGACDSNVNGQSCYRAVYNSFVNDNWPTKLMDGCFVNFTVFASVTRAESCSDGCREALQQAREDVGCCFNSIYNETFESDYLPFAEYSLWSDCGLESETPGFCSGLTSILPMSAGIYLLIAIAAATYFWF